jgi:hypothetical protein
MIVVVAGVTEITEIIETESADRAAIVTMIEARTALFGAPCNYGVSRE